MTTPDIAALRGLLEKATVEDEVALPWTFEPPTRDQRFGNVGSYINDSNGGWACSGDTESVEALIVAAINALPDLLSTIEGQAEALDLAMRRLNLIHEALQNPLCPRQSVGEIVATAIADIRQALGDAA